MPANFRIASVHFASLELRRPAYQGIYAVEAVVPGAPPKFVVSVTNHRGALRREEGISNRVQHDEGGYSAGSILGQRQKVNTTIYADEIAADLVNEWTRLPFGVSDKCHPGLWVVRDRVPAVDEDGHILTNAEGKQEWIDASREEQMNMWNEDMAAAREADAQYARKVFDYWDAQISKFPKMIEALPKMVREAAAAYGWTADWLRGTAAIATKICPWCSRNIREQAIICPHGDCQQVVDNDKWARLMSERKASLAKYGLADADIGELAITGATAGGKTGKAA